MLRVLCCSELKRRMKQEQKAKEKAEKEKVQQAEQSVKKKETAAVVKEEDISPNVSCISCSFKMKHFHSHTRGALTHSARCTSDITIPNSLELRS